MSHAYKQMTNQTLIADAIAQLETRLAAVKIEIAYLKRHGKPAGGILSGLDGRRFASVAAIKNL
jgi:hypothetical protein